MNRDEKTRVIPGSTRVLIWADGPMLVDWPVGVCCVRGGAPPASVLGRRLIGTHHAGLKNRSIPYVFDLLSRRRSSWPEYGLHETDTGSP